MFVDVFVDVLLVSLFRCRCVCLLFSCCCCVLVVALLLSF